MAKLHRRMMTLRRLIPHWSAIFLVASLLFCAAILLGPLASGNVSSRPGLGQRAQPIKLEAKTLEPVTGPRKAAQGLTVGKDTTVVRVSTGAR